MYLCNMIIVLSAIIAPEALHVMLIANWLS